MTETIQTLPHEEALAAPNINEQLQDFLTHFENEIIPSNAFEAEEVMGQLALRNQHLHAVKDRQGIDQETVGQFDELVRQGTDYWRLSEEERADMTQALTIKDVAELSPLQNSILRNTKSAEGPITHKELEEFKTKLSKRLLLDRQLQKVDGKQLTDDAEQSKQLRKSRPGQIGGVATRKIVRDPSDATENAARIPSEAATSKRRTQTHKRDGIKDLIKLDSTGRAHYESGNKVIGGKAAVKLKGKFMSKHELDLIDEHQGMIRAGMKERQRVEKLREQYKSRMIKTYGAEVYAERYANNPNVDPDAWRAREYGAAQPGNEGNLSEKNNQAPNSEPMPPDVTAEFWSSLPAEVRSYWGTLDDEEKQRLRDYLAAEDAQNTPLVREENGSIELRGRRERTELESVREPITDASPKGLRARLSRIWSKAGARLSSTDISGNKLFTTNEKASRNRKIAGAAIGALVATGTVALIILETKGGGVVHHAANHQPKQKAKGTNIPKVIHEHLRAGHTIEGNLREYAHAHGVNPSEHLLYQEDAKVLHENGITWNGARHMRTGQEYKIRQSILSDLLKRSKKR